MEHAKDTIILIERFNKTLSMTILSLSILIKCLGKKIGKGVRHLVISDY